MSIEYDRYLTEHIHNVQEAGHWMADHGLFPLLTMTFPRHDESKYSVEEYDAYDKYFYGNNKSYKVVNDFNYAWLHHIHNNPHHWQHWVLKHDDEPEEALEMPIEYVAEMIADWWSFSFKMGNYYEIFDWYDKHKAGMVLHKKTRKLVEDTLNEIRSILDRDQTDKM